MARTPRTFSGGGHAEAKAGENIRQGKPREDVTGRKTIAAVSTKATKDRTPAGYFSFSYSALASFRMGMSGSASFQRAKKSW